MQKYVIKTVALFEKFYYINANSREEAEAILVEAWTKIETGNNDLPYKLGHQIEDDIIFSIELSSESPSPRKTL